VLGLAKSGFGGVAGGGWLGRFMVFKDWGLKLLNIEMKCVILLALYQKV
jgi:hypothetical protein